MNTKTKLASLFLTSAIATTPFVAMNGAYATESNTTATAVEVVETANQSIIKTVDEAYNGMREIHAARLAIFNGDIETATQYVSNAEKEFSMAEKSITDYQIKTKSPSDTNDAFIPFDVKIGLSEGFVPTEDKQPHIVKANEHLKKGEQQQAIEVLRLANIEVTVSAALLPAQTSINHIKDAVNLINDNKFYEANLALKAVEDSVILDYYSIDAIPLQGSQS